MRNFYEYTGTNKQTFHGYLRRYKGHRLQKQGFTKRSDAETSLRQAMNDIDAEERGEIRCKPTTAQEALDIYRRKLDIRGKDKSQQYRHNINSNCKIIQEFVDRFGPNNLIRTCTEEDLREFYQILCFRPTLNQNSAAVFIGRIQGMMKAAQAKKPDLINWRWPNLKVQRKPDFERRYVEMWEYKYLVEVLLNPPQAPSRRAERKALWRDAGDVMQLLRQTGGRFNEVLRIRLDQFHWQKGHVTLEASKTENERNIPLWGTIREIIQRRIHENLTDEVYLFPRARVETFDNAIARAYRKAAVVANKLLKEQKDGRRINYGLAGGFTAHSLRHTFITHLMEITGNDAGTVMAYSGHKTLQAFSVYLRPRQTGRILATQAMNDVGHFLGTFPEHAGSPGNTRTLSEPLKPLKEQQVAS
jgi:integrase